MKQTIAVFVGTRPEAIKMAPVIHSLRQSSSLQPRVVSTGQHKEMLKQVIDLFGIPVDHELDVMQPNQTLAGLTARLLQSIDELLVRDQPAMALVQGDTTTVLAAALACFYRRVPLGHVEAGLRTGQLDAPFPEEANRTLASKLVRLHFAPTEFGRDNLLREGVPSDHIFVTGNTVIDALFAEVAKQSHPEIVQKIDSELFRLIAADWRVVPYVLVTGHRRENFGRGFQEICQALATLANRFPNYRFVYPVHLNPSVQKPVYETLGTISNFRLIPPQDYRIFTALMRQSVMVLTDSGGVQEEAPSLGKPVLVMRDTTERPEGVHAGTVRLVGAHADRIVEQVSRLLLHSDEYRAMSEARNPYGDGNASSRIVEVLERFFC